MIVSYYIVTAADLRTVSPYNLILKYADDTYLIIPASNIQSRTAELQNVEQWAAANNLKLNRAKTSEIIITTKGKSKSLQPLPPLLPDIVRVTRLKILGVTVSDKLSISEHVQHVVSRCAQSLHALRILRSCGMEDNILQLVFTSVILGRMTYAINAWWGYATAADKQRLDAFI